MDHGSGDDEYQLPRVKWSENEDQVISTRLDVQYCMTNDINVCSKADKWPA